MERRWPLPVLHQEEMKHTQLQVQLLYVCYIVSKSCVCICQIMYRTSLAGQPLHKRGRVWCHAYTWVVPALMQHLWICYKDLAPDWPVYTLGIAPAN